MTEIQTDGKCRVCLLVAAQHLFNWHKIMDLSEKLTYAECFHQCTQLALQDECVLLPQLLCYDCATELRHLYGFIKKARQADETLRRIKDAVSSSSTETRKVFEWVDMENQTIKLETLNEEENATEFCEEQSVNATADREELELKEDLDIENNISPTSTLGEKDVAEYELGQTCVLGAPADEDLLHAYEEPALEDEFNNFTDGVIEIEVMRPQQEANDLNVTKKSPYKSRRRRRSRIALKEQMVTCEYCNKSISKTQYRRHIIHEHKKLLFLCHTCPRSFSSKRNLVQHMATHEENRERNYNCELCDGKFLTLDSYRLHIKTHDPNRKRYQCDQCEKSFLYKPGLKLHQQRHNGDTIDCNICHKKYLRQYDLEIHMRSHSGDTPYKCSYCDKAYSHLSAMNSHMQVHQERFKCDICLKEFTRKASLRKHLKLHTGLPYKCAICDKEYAMKFRLRKHIISAHNKLEDADEHIIKVKAKTFRGRIIED